MAAADPFQFFGTLFGKAMPPPNAASEVLRAGVAHAASEAERARYVDMGMGEAAKDRGERRFALGVLLALGVGCLALALVRERAG